MNYRSPKLIALAADCPRCMSCGLVNLGTVVACHSNSQRHGKGMGLKSHDVVAYLCQECHDRIDGRVGTLTRRGPAGGATFSENTMQNCPNCELMRNVIGLEIQQTSDPMTVHNLQTLLNAVSVKPEERGEKPLFREV